MSAGDIVGSRSSMRERPSPSGSGATPGDIEGPPATARSVPGRNPGWKCSIGSLHRDLSTAELAGLMFATIIALAGCRHARVGDTEVPTGSRLSDAKAFETGHGRPRDYAEAASIYKKLCQEGQGNPSACRY